MVLKGKIKFLMKNINLVLIAKFHSKMYSQMSRGRGKRGILFFKSSYEKIFNVKVILINMLMNFHCRNGLQPLPFESP